MIENNTNTIQKKSSKNGVRKKESIVSPLKKICLNPFNSRIHRKGNTPVQQKAMMPLTRDKHFPKNIVLYIFVSIQQLSACGADCFNIISRGRSIPGHSLQICPSKRLGTGAIPAGDIYLPAVAHSCN